MPNKPAKLVYSNGLITANDQQRRNKLTLATDILFTTPVVAKQGHKRMNSSFTRELSISVYSYSLMLGEALNIVYIYVCCLYIYPLSINYKLQSY